jgi:hypothetical protein
MSGAKSQSPSWLNAKDRRISACMSWPGASGVLSKVRSSRSFAMSTECTSSPVGASVGRRADDHRHAEPARGQEHQLEIVPLPFLGTAVLVGAERLGADVRAPGVGDDGVGPARQPDLEAASLDGREAEVARRRENAHPLGHQV